MLAQVEPKVLQQATSTLKFVIDKHKALPILHTYLIQAVAGRLILRATNLNEFLTYIIPARVSREGVVCVEGRKLDEIIKKLTSEFILAKSDDGLTITSGRTKFKLNKYDEDDFVEFPSVDGFSFTLPSEVLRVGINKVKYAIAKDDVRVGLNSLYIHSVENNLHFVASDGHRLALYVYPDVEINVSMLLSRVSLTTLKNLLKGYEGEITITPSNQLVKFSTEDWEFITRLSEGEYPDYMSILNNVKEKQTYTITIAREGLLESLYRALAISSSAKTMPVVLTFMKDQVNIKAEDVEYGEFQEIIDVFDGFFEDKFIIGFNARYLIEAIENFDSEKITFGIIDEESPILIYDEQNNYKALVMPMRV